MTKYVTKKQLKVQYSFQNLLFARSYHLRNSGYKNMKHIIWYLTDSLKKVAVKRDIDETLLKDKRHNTTYVYVITKPRTIHNEDKFVRLSKGKVIEAKESLDMFALLEAYELIDNYYLKDLNCEFHIRDTTESLPKPISSKIDMLILLPKISTQQLNAKVLTSFVQKKPFDLQSKLTEYLPFLSINVTIEQYQKQQQSTVSYHQPVGFSNIGKVTSNTQLADCSVKSLSDGSLTDLHECLKNGACSILWREDSTKYVVIVTETEPIWTKGDNPETDTIGISFIVSNLSRMLKQIKSKVVVIATPEVKKGWEDNFQIIDPYANILELLPDDSLAVKIVEAILLMKPSVSN